MDLMEPATTTSPSEESSPPPYAAASPPPYSEPASISSCPIEILNKILGYVAADTRQRTTLAGCARVCWQWKEPANRLLFRSVRVNGNRMAAILARSLALRRYRRWRLEIKNVDHNWSDVEMILSQSEGVVELSIDSGSTHSAPASLFYGPVLKDLQVLNLSGGVSTFILPFWSIPFRLHTLSTNFALSQASILNELVANSLSDTPCRLTTLELNTPSAGTALESLYDLAPQLSSLTLSNLLLDRAMNQYLQTFISKTESLSTLRLSPDSRSTRNEVPTFLRQLLFVLPAPLKTLFLDLKGMYASEELLNAILEVVEWSPNLESLAHVDFARDCWLNLVQLTRWDKLSRKFEKKGIELGVMDKSLDWR